MWGETETPGAGTTILQKTHSLPQSLLAATAHFPMEYRVDPSVPTKLVLLMRNPAEALLALRHYHAAGHTGFAQPAHFRGKDWAEFTSERSVAWFELYKAWLQWPSSSMLVMHYEQIQAAPLEESLRLLKFLGAPLDMGRLQCSLRYTEGQFKRPSYPKHMQGYSIPRNVSQYLQDAQRRLNLILEEKNFPRIPAHLYRFSPSVIDTISAFAR
ncbi:WSC domain-containing protein 2-like [Hyalella azteca]|uniref:WSC domain-containing protein 2-like n=1 Tax=Hyalella azteca TaxID=294128 RepID=A0A979FR32_HYAAZ|nr:WSC domain-containing protein 2-like [Hyalella azteca]